MGGGACAFASQLKGSGGRKAKAGKSAALPERKRASPRRGPRRLLEAGDHEPVEWWGFGGFRINGRGDSVTARRVRASPSPPFGPATELALLLR